MSNSLPKLLHARGRMAFCSRPLSRIGNLSAGALRLARNSAGNVLAMTAVGMLLVAMLGGGAIDIGRVYLTKDQLQGACDAAVLATRKSMRGTTMDKTAKQAGLAMFAINFPAGSYGTTSARISLSADGRGIVSGDARATAATAVFGSIGAMPKTIQTSCAADLDLGNTDIVFALDTTKSMNGTIPGDGVTRIEGLKRAVSAFAEAMDQARTSEIQVRYGFVPFASTVNVGRLLRQEWMVDNWTYQSRVPGPVVRQNGQTIYNWVYKPVTYDVRALKGAGPLMSGAALTIAGIGPGHSTQTIPWDGCIEERETVRDTDFSVIPSAAYDLDIDQLPHNDATRWRPFLPQLVYWRRDNEDWDTADWSTSENSTRSDMFREGNAAVCPFPARKLSSMARSDVDAYVAGLIGAGNTHLDIGMIWAARLLSPSGLFAAENQTGPNGAPIVRHIVFMTDGEIDTKNFAYDAYGLAALDRRRTNPDHVPSNDEQNALVDARFRAVCAAAKRKGITIWTVAFATDVTDTLKSCSSGNRYYMARNATELNETFASIASSIAKLRLIK